MLPKFLNPFGYHLYLFLILLLIDFLSTTYYNNHDNLQQLELNENFQYLNPCKANAFMGDIALTDDEKMRMLERDILLTRKSIQSWEQDNFNSSNQFTHKTRLKDKVKNLPENSKRKPDVIKTKEWWILYYKSFNLTPSQIRRLVELRFSPINRLKRHTHRKRYRRAATSFKFRTWSHGIIPYFIQANFSSETKATIMKAMRHWENYTCLSFIPKRSSDKSYIIFTEKTCGCCSYVGRRSEEEPQAISIGKNCDKKGIVIHELGHVIGFWHEHTRPDRDDHVEILLENVVVGQDFNFKKMESHEVDSLNEPYDYQSIMHYAKGTFSKANKEWTIRPKACCPRPPIGQRIMLSPGDIRQTNKLYNCPKCGKTLLEYSDKFSSPERENEWVFSGPLDCQWRISVTEGERVSINISDFEISPGVDCTTNYLEIRDGVYENSEVLGRYCGKVVIPSIISKGSRVLIKYKNQDPSRSTGFSSSYQAICGGEIHASEGRIISPNYPEMYKSNKQCIWKITVPVGYSIALKFESFKIEKHDTCVYDFLEIRDGLDEQKRLLSKICGYQIPGPIKTTNNQMYIKFMSDSSVEKQGFTAHFQQEHDECKNMKHGCQHICVNTLGAYMCACDIGYELQPDGKSCENACGGLIKESNGSLHSPNYPSNYPPNKKCIWRIVAPEKAKIFFNFTEFDVEGKEKDCQYDYVNVYDGPESNQKKLGKYCGKKPPQPITSTTNELTIAFYSDSTVQKKGFKIYFFTDRNECEEKNGGCEHFCVNTIGSYYCQCRPGHQLHGKQNCKEKTVDGCIYEINEAHGEIKSPNYPIAYPAKSNCEWKINTTPGHIIQLTFADFEIESHQECTYDQLIIYDGSSNKNKQLGRFCGGKTPIPMKSQYNSILITFSSDGSVQRRGFKISFTSVCDGKLIATEEPQVIFSHATYGTPYNINQNCLWVLETLNQQQTVQLKFLHFEVEPENQCTYDSVKIYDGSSVMAPVIGQYCGTTIPAVITSQSGNLLIHFVSDDTVNAKGFKAEYKAVAKSQKNVKDIQTYRYQYQVQRSVNQNNSKKNNEFIEHA